jgi:2,3-bisphosphoglycerate-dependent phosphoglycerate mutase
MRMQGQFDTALDALGRWQAEQVAEALQDEPIDAIVSSDLARAMCTAMPLARRRGLRVRPDPALRERSFGVFQGFTYAHIEKHWPESAARWHARDPAFGAEGGETLAGFYQRVIDAAHRLALEFAGRSVVWATHGGVLDCLHRAAMRVALDASRSWTLDNASINRLLHSDQGLMLVGWGDVRHLDAATTGSPAIEA